MITFKENNAWDAEFRWFSIKYCRKDWNLGRSLFLNFLKKILIESSKCFPLSTKGIFDIVRNSNFIQRKDNFVIKNYYVVRNARCECSRYTQKLSFIFLKSINEWMNQLINRVYLERFIWGAYKTKLKSNIQGVRKWRTNRNWLKLD